MKWLLILAAAAVVLALAATASAHRFVSSPSLSIHKQPTGTTSPGKKVIVFGKVRSSRGICREDRLVRLFRVRPGPNRLLATFVTNFFGDYRFARHPRRTQKVYTRIPRLHEVSFGHDHLCRAARSRDLRIRVR